MPDELDEFFQCVSLGGEWLFQVGVVQWEGPGEPMIEWKTFRRWKTAPDAARMARARAAALRLPAFFRTCKRCQTVVNAGHMHDRVMCQSCAETELGVVY